MTLSIIVPCYNEEAVLHETNARLTDVIKRMETEALISHGRIMYVNDGSADRTWQIIEELAQADQHVGGLCLAHNVGHQQALWAGLEWAAAHSDAAISIDADLQDDVEAIPQMVELWLHGADVVYGVRRERKTDTWFKRTTAQGFYRLMRVMGSEVVYNHADFRLMSRRALQALMAYPERNLFLRGMVAQLGFNTASVYYDRAERFAGESKYPLTKMLGFALDGITSFSVRPLQYITYLGAVFMLISICAIVYGIVSYIEGRTIAGWTSQLVSIWFIGGAILLACGIIGEYVGKIYTEVKRRPRYFIQKTAGHELS
jgi:glycosyltransferase involved in cell wall biosynthesis